MSECGGKEQRARERVGGAGGRAGATSTPAAALPPPLLYAPKGRQHKVVKAHWPLKVLDVADAHKQPQPALVHGALIVAVQEEHVRGYLGRAKEGRDLRAGREALGAGAQGLQRRPRPHGLQAQDARRGPRIVPVRGGVKEVHVLHARERQHGLADAHGAGGRGGRGRRHAPQRRQQPQLVRVRRQVRCQGAAGQLLQRRAARRLGGLCRRHRPCRRGGRQGVQALLHHLRCARVKHGQLGSVRAPHDVLQLLPPAGHCDARRVQHQRRAPAVGGSERWVKVAGQGAAAGGGANRRRHQREGGSVAIAKEARAGAGLCGRPGGRGRGRLLCVRTAAAAARCRRRRRRRLCRRHGPVRHSLGRGGRSQRGRGRSGQPQHWALPGLRQRPGRARVPPGGARQVRARSQQQQRDGALDARPEAQRHLRHLAVLFASLEGAAGALCAAQARRSGAAASSGGAGRLRHGQKHINEKKRFCVFFFPPCCFYDGASSLLGGLMRAPC